MLVELARRHGLEVEVQELDETGWDFQVGHAVDASGAPWVLRVPRRAEVAESLQVERRLLSYLRPQLPVDLPEWEICAPDLVAYRRLPGRPLGPEHPDTLEYQWWIEPPAAYFDALGAVIAALHRVPPVEVAELGVSVGGADALRRELAAELARAESEVDVPARRRDRWRAWLDDDRCWRAEPRFVHADLHPGHTLVDETGHLLGILDWTDAAVDDPAVDFIAACNAFGMAGVDRVLTGYRDAGGAVPAGFREHIGLLSSFRFSVSLALHGRDIGDPGFVAIAQRRLLG